MNKLWRKCGKFEGGVKKVIQSFGEPWKSGGFAQFLSEFCWRFCWGFPRGCSLLFVGNDRFAHRTTVTTIKIIRERN